MLKKLIGVVAVTTMALVASVSTASAQTYPPPDDAIRAIGNPGLQFEPGGPAVFEAECFLPGSTVTFTLDGEALGTAVANADGLATLSTTIPDDTPAGPADVVASGTGCDGEALTLVLSVTIVGGLPREDPTTTIDPGATGGGSGGPLPRTGAESLPMVQIALATLITGGFLVIMANKRRAAVVPARGSSRT